MKLDEFFKLTKWKILTTIILTLSTVPFFLIYLKVAFSSGILNTNPLLYPLSIILYILYPGIILADKLSSEGFSSIISFPVLIIVQLLWSYILACIFAKIIPLIRKKRKKSRSKK